MRQNEPKMMWQISRTELDNRFSFSEFCGRG